MFWVFPSPLVREYLSPASCLLLPSSTPASQLLTTTYATRSIAVMTSLSKSIAHGKWSPFLRSEQTSSNNHFRIITKNMYNFHCEIKSRRQRDRTSRSLRSLSKQFFQRCLTRYIPQRLGRGTCALWGSYYSLFSKKKNVLSQWLWKVLMSTQWEGSKKTS